MAPHPRVHPGPETREILTGTPAVAAHRVRVGETRCDLGDPGSRARITSFAYTADPPVASRPVLFAWNGGPIVPSVPLHLGLLGPVRLRIPDPRAASARPAALAANPHSPLDVCDVVLFDPPGTGLSRVDDGVDPLRFYDTESDAALASAYVLHWLAEHGRRDAPVYLLGESYGSIRAALVAEQLGRAGCDLRGIVLVSQIVNQIEVGQRRANIVSYPTALPTYAAIAWYHRRGAFVSGALDDAVAAAGQLAGDRYLTWLHRGTVPDSAVARELAGDLAALTGIPTGTWLRQDLRLSKNDFRAHLLADAGLVPYMFDARYTGQRPPRLADAGERALGDVLGNWDPPGTDVVASGYDAAFIGYLRDGLHVPDWQDYLFKPRDAPASGPSWTWRQSTSPFGDWRYAATLGETLRRHPHVRVLVVSGAFDLSTTIGAAWHLAGQSGWPPAQVDVAYYAGGHMVFSDDGAAAALAAALRRFVSG